MNIVSLNTWGGRLNERLMIFLKNYPYIDVFCFQEVLSSGPMASRDVRDSSKDTNMRLFSDISSTLSDYTGVFSPTADYIDVVDGLWIDASDSLKCPLSIGNAIFVRKDHTILASGDHFIYGNRNYKSLKKTKYSPKSMQYVVVRRNNCFDSYSIFNVHGMWNGGGKKDSKQRIKQSEKIIKFIKHFGGKRVLCGDFNLEPDTKSIKILENQGEMINLINKYRIKSTRTKLYRHYDTQSLYADYVFVSKDIEVDKFYVNHETSAEVSDHAPLFLTCS